MWRATVERDLEVSRRSTSPTAMGRRPSFFFRQARRVAPGAEVRKDGRRHTTGGKEVYKPCQGDENLIGLVRGGAIHSLTKVTGSEARGTRGGTIREGLHSPADKRLRDPSRWWYWAGGRVGGVACVCLICISWMTSGQGVARPSEVRAWMAFLY